MGIVTPLPRRQFGLTARIADRMVRRHTGAQIDFAPLAYAARIPALLRATAGMERFFVGRRATEMALFELGAVRAASELGCRNCLDIGSYMLATKFGLSDEQLHAISDHRRHAELFSDEQLTVMDLAVAMTATPPTIDDELEARLHEQFTEEQRLELIAMIGWENYRSRFNIALGLTAQGYTEYASCRMVAPSEQASTAPAEEPAVVTG
jgi:alkylhydroperoxidase family enzyme